MRAVNAARLSTHSTQLPAHIIWYLPAINTIRMAAQSSYRKIGDSPSASSAISQNHLGRWKRTIRRDGDKQTAAMCPKPWASVWAPIGLLCLDGAVRGRRFPRAEYHQTRFRFSSGDRLVPRNLYCLLIRGPIMHWPSFPASNEE